MAPAPPSLLTFSLSLSPFPLSQVPDGTPEDNEASAAAGEAATGSFFRGRIGRGMTAKAVCDGIGAAKGGRLVRLWSGSEGKFLRDDTPSERMFLLAATGDLEVSLAPVAVAVPDPGAGLSL